MPDTRTRHRQTGEEFVGEGAVPGGYELVQPADTRSPFAKWYSGMAKAPTEAVNRLAYGATEPLVAIQRRAMGESPEQVTANPEGPMTPATSPGVGEVVVPQTPLQAGILGGTLAAGPLVGGAARAGLPLAGKISPWLARVLGGTAGGAAGGTVGDEGPVSGAAW